MNYWLKQCLLDEIGTEILDFYKGKLFSSSEEITKYY